MVCKVCGRTISNENANFCEYCGASFREQGMNELNNGQNMSYNQQNVYSQNDNSQGNNQQGYANQGYNQQGYGQTGYNSPQAYYNQMNGSQASGQMTSQEDGKPVPFWHWLGFMLLPFIPIVGGLVYIVLLFIFAFGREGNKTRKNWARATLVVGLISIIILIVVFGSAIGQIASSGMTMEEYLNNLGTY